MKKINSMILAVLLSLLIIPTAQASTLENVKTIVETEYYGEVPVTIKSMQTISEIIKSLDGYSQYMTKKEFDSYMKMIGVATLEHGLVALDTSTPTSVTSKLLYGGTGYIKLANFPQNLGSTVAIHWKALEKRGAKTLIMDLRNNGGGFVESAEELLGFFEGAKNSFYIYTRHKEELRALKATQTLFPKEVYALINHQSASASEIVAVSLKDQKAATIIGQSTFGKGTIQSFFPLADASVLKLTTGQFKGPAGTVVDKTGVLPEITTNPGEELTEAHRIILEKSLNKHYTKKLGHIIISDPNARIQIKLPHIMNFSTVETSNRVELVEIGGGALPISISQHTDYRTIDITPQSPLEKGKEYIAIFRPEIKQLNGKRSKMGVYTPISVTND